jgi:hypothetical protein
MWRQASARGCVGVEGGACGEGSEESRERGREVLRAVRVVAISGPLAKGWLACSPAHMVRLGDHRVTGLLRAAAAQATVGPDWIVNKADVRILISSPRPTYLHHTCSCALFLCRFVCVGRVLQQVVFDSSKPVGVGGFAQVFKGRCDVHLACTRCVLLSSFIPTPTPIHALTDTLTLTQTCTPDARTLARARV